MNEKPRKALPAPERAHLHLGYMRLNDSAPLVMAQELGLYRKYGLDVTLHREVSWANIRDKIIAGAFDACHMLAPLPLITTLGAAGIRAPMITGLVLSLNGNGITVSSALWEAMCAASPVELVPDNARDSAHALRAALGRRPNLLQAPFATVNPFSTHTLLLRLWLRAAGLDPDRDVRIIVLPPEQMADSLAQGIVEGFCVGEPWNSVAVEYGAGVLATTGFAVWNNAPEKVLGVLEDWHRRHPATHLRLRLAIMEASQWLADMDNRPEAVEVLARAGHLDLPARYLKPSLCGELALDRKRGTHRQTNFHVFSQYHAGFPWRSHADLLLRQCSSVLGRSLDEEKLAALAQQCYRTDLYREAARLLDWPVPQQDYKREGEHEAPWELDRGIELGSDLVLGEFQDARA